MNIRLELYYSLYSKSRENMPTQVSFNLPASCISAHRYNERSRDVLKIFCSFSLPSSVAYPFRIRVEAISFFMKFFTSFYVWCVFIWLYLYRTVVCVYLCFIASNDIHGDLNSFLNRWFVTKCDLLVFPYWLWWLIDTVKILVCVGY